MTRVKEIYVNFLFQDRIRSYMTRVKEIQEKEKAPKIDQGAAKRFVRSALWQQAHSQTPQQKKGGRSAHTLDSRKYRPLFINYKFPWLMVANISRK